MPYGGNDWLALTQEPTVEPELPICDAHHHFWDLRPERLPYQRYLLHELVADVTCGHNVQSTVFIETRAMYRPDGPVELRPVGEVEFVQGLAAASASGLYGPSRAAAAIIGHADLKLGDRVEPSWRPYRPRARIAFAGSAISLPGMPTRGSKAGRSRRCCPPRNFAQAPRCWAAWACRWTRSAASRNCLRWSSSPVPFPK